MTATETSTDRIERTVLLKATPERVWRALSDAEEFGSWFGLNLKGQRFVAGERLRAQLTIKGYEHVMLDVHIVEMRPLDRFSYRWHPYAIDQKTDFSKEETTLVVITLKAADGGTKLTVVESGFDKIPAERRLEAFRQNSKGWEGQLRNIARHLGE